MTLFTLLYYCGMIVCGIQGAQKAKNDHTLTWLYCFLNAMGGGLLRDTIALCTFPVAFTPDTTPDILIAETAGIGFVYLHYLNYVPNWSWLLLILDTISIPTFLIIGADKATAFNAPFILVVICSIVTGLGGSSLVLTLYKRPVKEVVLSNSLYKIAVTMNAVLYCVMIRTGCSCQYAQCQVILLTAICTLVCSDLFWSAIKQIIPKNYNNQLHLYLCCAYWVVIIQIIISAKKCKAIAHKDIDYLRELSHSVKQTRAFHILFQRLLQM